MSEKVLVTGGAGFIGSHIVDKMVEGGYDVAVLDNLSTGSQENLNPKARFYEGDIRKDAEKVFNEEKPNILVHHAAQISIKHSIDDPVNDAQQNIIGTLELLERCRAHGIEKIVFPSSSSVYGNADSFPTKEDAPLRPMNPYAIAKATIERYLDFYLNIFGIDYIAFRYSNVYGPRQNPKGEAGVISVFIDQMLQGKTPCIWGNGKQSRDFIHVSDVAAANLAAINYKGNVHVFNIATGDYTAVNNISGMLQAYFSCYKVDHDARFREPVMKICLDASLAREELGWEPQMALYPGLTDTAGWFKKRHDKMQKT